MTEGTAAVERMYRALLQEISGSRPELLDESFTVAEIYQNLIPYRTHRDLIGTEMSGDYEHVLMRLLAGEGDYLTLESETARRKILEELDSIHPDTGFYRDFAACEVRLNRDQLSELDSTSRSGPGNGARPEEGPVAVDGTLPDEPEAEGAVSLEGESDPDVGGDERTGLGAEACRWCREPLPDRDDLQYCPYCGSSVDLLPCSRCGAEIEVGWSFCVACGSEAGD